MRHSVSEPPVEKRANESSAGSWAASANRPLRFVTFLAPNMLNVYRFIAKRVGSVLGIPTEVAVGSSYDEMDTADIAFLCGLPYVLTSRQPNPPFEPIAAPVLRGERYGGQPVYFSDVIVRRDSPCHSFADLRGRSWAYNEPLSQSGYGITRHHLLRLGETNGYFGKVIEAGWHEVALRMVSTGAVDASAIDSQVLAVALRDDPELAGQLRVIGTLGPSPIQPVVAARTLPAALKSAVRRILLELADAGEAEEELARGIIERFVEVDDRGYDEIRTMLAAAEAADFLEVR
jgi:phosphonate transport system substrate-binding protein